MERQLGTAPGVEHCRSRVQRQNRRHYGHLLNVGIGVEETSKRTIIQRTTFERTCDSCIMLEDYYTNNRMKAPKVARASNSDFSWVSVHLHLQVLDGKKFITDKRGMRQSTNSTVRADGWLIHGTIPTSPWQTRIFGWLPQLGPPSETGGPAYRPYRILIGLPTS